MNALNSPCDLTPMLALHMATEIDNSHVKLNMPQTSARSPSLNSFLAVSSSYQLMAAATPYSLLLRPLLRITSLVPYISQPISTSYWFCILNVSRPLPFVTISSAMTLLYDTTMPHQEYCKSLLTGLPFLPLPHSSLFSNQQPNVSFSRFLLCPKPSNALYDFHMKLSFFLGHCFPRDRLFQVFTETHLLNKTPTLTTLFRITTPHVLSAPS